MAISKRRPPPTTATNPAQAAIDRATASARASVADKAAAAAESRPANHPAPVGHNEPPKDDSLQAHRDRYAELRQAGEAWLTTGIADQETADLAEAWRKQVNAARKAADAQRAAEKKPHDDAGKAVQAKWLPVIEAFDRLDTPIRAKLTDFAKAERDRIAREREAAEKAAEEAKRSAEQAAEKALTTGTFSAHDHAAELARQAEDAEAAAKQAAAKKVGLGGSVVVDGRKRTASLHTFEVLSVTDPVAALAHLVAMGGTPPDAVIDGIKTLFRVVRKANPEAAAKCPGIGITTEERII